MPRHIGAINFIQVPARRGCSIQTDKSRRPVFLALTFFSTHHHYGWAIGVIQRTYVRNALTRKAPKRTEVPPYTTIKKNAHSTGGTSMMFDRRSNVAKLFSMHLLKTYAKNHFVRTRVKIAEATMGRPISHPVLTSLLKEC